MIIRQDLRRELQKVAETQCFMTATQFAKCMGIKTRDYAKREFLSGLECVNGKYYFIQDIIDALMSRIEREED